MKKNISVVKCFDLLTIKTVHEISERLKDWNIINIISFGLCMISQRWIDCILYYNVNQSNGISIIWWLFENRDFILQRLKILLIVEVDHLLMTWKTFDRMLLRLWENFFSWAKNLDAENTFKKYYDLCTKYNVCRKYPEKPGSITLKLKKKLWNYLVAIVTQVYSAVCNQSRGINNALEFFSST